jgi:hypothetical protein
MDYIWFCVFLGGVALILLAVIELAHRWARRRREKLVAHGEIAAARVIIVWDDDGGRHMTYRFQAASQGTSVLASASIEGLYAVEPKAGDEVRVVYDPQRPEKSMPLASKGALDLEQ